MQAQAVETGAGKDDCIVCSILQSLKARFHITPNVYDLQVRAKRQQLRLPRMLPVPTREPAGRSDNLSVLVAMKRPLHLPVQAQLRSGVRLQSKWADLSCCGLRYRFFSRSMPVPALLQIRRPMRQERIDAVGFLSAEVLITWIVTSASGKCLRI